MAILRSLLLLLFLPVSAAHLSYPLGSDEARSVHVLIEHLDQDDRVESKFEMRLIGDIVPLEAEDNEPILFGITLYALRFDYTVDGEKEFSLSTSPSLDDSYADILRSLSLTALCGQPVYRPYDGQTLIPLEGNPFWDNLSLIGEQYDLGKLALDLFLTNRELSLIGSSFEQGSCVGQCTITRVDETYVGVKTPAGMIGYTRSSPLKVSSWEVSMVEDGIPSDEPWFSEKMRITRTVTPGYGGTTSSLSERL